MTVGSSAFFDYAEFEGPVDFGYIDIGESFYANSARFINKEYNKFSDVKVGVDAFFNNSVLTGSLVFLS